MQLPTATKLDKRLLLGSLAFGIGWGIAGFCPGPAIVSAAAGQPKAWIFVAAMLVGMVRGGVMGADRTSRDRLADAAVDLVLKGLARH